VQQYERHLEESLFALQSELASGNYRHGSYSPFQICDPKQRSIHKATVRDRVAHQLVVSSIEPLFERQFIHDSFSCRKHKGTHAAVKRLRTLLNRASSNNTRTVYALKCDIRKFFASVDHANLRDLLKRRIADPQILDLLDEVINSHTVSPGKGMPLGNLTSQLIANIYLHELDWFVKQTIGRKFYVRYCDDFVILSHDRQELLELVPKIADFLESNLALSLHPNKVVIRSWHQGIDFLGYVLKPHCTVLRTKTKNRMLARVNQDNLTSYEGLCSHASAYRTTQLIKTKALTANGTAMLLFYLPS
jgi:RNA-directed DNA polymerase